MSKEKRSRKLHLTDELSQRQRRRLTQLEHDQTEHVLSQPSFPDRNDTAVEYTTTPSRFVHPASRKVRKIHKKRLRGAAPPD